MNGGKRAGGRQLQPSRRSVLGVRRPAREHSEKHDRIIGGIDQASGFFDCGIVGGAEAGESRHEQRIMRAWRRHDLHKSRLRLI
jgi:hypothetical protein